MKTFFSNYYCCVILTNLLHSSVPGKRRQHPPVRTVLASLVSLSRWVTVFSSLSLILLNSYRVKSGQCDHSLSPAPHRGFNSLS